MKEFDWEKFILIAFCTFLGGAFLVNLIPIPEYIDKTIGILPKLPELALMLNWIALICGLVGLSGYFYYHTLLKKDGYSNEEGSFYDQKHNRIRIVKAFSIFCCIFTLMAFGLTMLNEMPEYYDWVMIVNLLICGLGEAANNSLIATVRPELEESLTGLGLNKTYFKKLDEREKERAGRASFKTMNLMGFAYCLVFLIFIVLIGVYQVSPIICIPVGMLWFLQTLTMLYYSCKEH